MTYDSHERATRLVSQVATGDSQEVDVGLINSLAKSRSPVTQQEVIPIDTIPLVKNDEANLH